MSDPRGVVVAGSAVILHGPALRAALDCVLIAGRSRRLSGLPDSRAYLGLAEALLRASASGRSDVLKHVPAQYFPVAPTVPIEEAADMLRLSRRQTRRIAPRLGGRIIAGRWLLDRTAIDEHLTGRRSP
jgi:hypothetical protein